MPVIRIGDLTTYAGDTSGSWLVVNDPTNTTTYKAQREQLLSGNFAGTASYALTASYVLNGGVIAVTGSTLYSTDPATSEFNPENSIFLGSQAGYQATYAYDSNFLGQNAGASATNANSSNFIGYNAGYLATNANHSNFFGSQAGYQAITAERSNFIGQGAGSDATNASNSNFLGGGAGAQATNAECSNFLGLQAGRLAASASYSTLIGYKAGENSAGGDLGIKSNNIIIGTNITLEDGRQDSINLGGIIFGTGSYFDINTTSSGSANGRIGINQPLPQYSLDVSGSGNYTSGLTVTGSLIAQNVTASNALFTGTITAQRLVTQVITSSTEWITGSTKFGSQLTDTHQFTGSVNVTSSLIVNGNVGINTSSPRAPLEVVGNIIAKSGSNLVIYNPETGWSGAMTVNDGYHTVLNGKAAGIDGGTGQIAIGGTVTADTNASNFNIALGYSAFCTTKPLRSIAIGYQAIANGTNTVALGYGANAPEGTFVLNAGGAERMRIDSSGNLMIGHPTSSYKFQVSGSGASGSLNVNNVLYVSGSSVQVTGSLSVGSGITGSLFGTSSWAQNVPASGVTGLNLSQIATGSISASVNVNSASFQITSASSQLLFVSNSGLITGRRLFLSSSQNTATGSTLIVFGSGSAQPVFTVQGSQGELFSVNDSLSGSLFSVNDISGLPIIEAFSDNRILIGSYQAPALFTTVRITSTQGSNTIYQNLPTASYDGAFFDYTLRSGSNARAGQITAIWSASAVNYTETVTTDFGDTTGVRFAVIVTGSNMALTGSFPSASWTMKTIVRSI